MTPSSDGTLYVAYTLVDPSGDLPEDAIAFAFADDGVHIYDGSTREPSGVRWAWDAISDVDGIRDSADPDDMELLCVTVGGVGDLQFECNDSKQLTAFFRGEHRPARQRLGSSTAAKPATFANVSPTSTNRFNNAITGVPVAKEWREDGEQQQQQQQQQQQKEQQQRRRDIEAGTDGSESDGDDGLGMAGSMSTSKKLKPNGMSILPEMGPMWSLVLLIVFFILTCVMYGSVLSEVVDGASGGSTESAPGGAGQRRWTIVDALYFCITTVTTVGYGDLAPKTEQGKYFTMFFVFAAVFGVGMALGEVAHWLVERAEKKRQEALRAMVEQTKLTKTSSGKTVLRRRFSGRTLQTMRAGRKSAAQFARKTRWLRKCLHIRKKDVKLYFRYLKALLPVFVALALGQVLVPLEGWSHTNAWYVACVSLTTVGFGDISPATQEGRLYCIFYIPVGLSLVLGGMGKVVELRLLSKTKKLSSIKELLEMDASGDGEVNLQEFQLAMLKNMGKITISDLGMLEHQFKILDKSGDGLLSADDIDAESEKAAMSCGKKRIQV